MTKTSGLESRETPWSTTPAGCECGLWQNPHVGEHSGGWFRWLMSRENPPRPMSRTRQPEPPPANRAPTEPNRHRTLRGMRVAMLCCCRQGWVHPHLVWHMKPIYLFHSTVIRPVTRAREERNLDVGCWSPVIGARFTLHNARMNSTFLPPPCIHLTFLRRWKELLPSNLCCVFLPSS